jgi:hypothetical protein
MSVRSLSVDLGYAQAMVNSLSDVIIAARAETDGIAQSTLWVAEAVLAMIAVKLDIAEQDAMTLENRLEH